MASADSAAQSKAIADAISRENRVDRFPTYPDSARGVLVWIGALDFPRACNAAYAAR
jgi:hypothetical protein